MQRKILGCLRWFALLALLFAVGPVGSAFAEAKRVAVMDFKGPSAAPTRKDIVKTLSGSDVKVVGSKQVDAAAKKLGVSVKNDAGRVKVAEKLHLSAFVFGTIDKNKKGFKVTLTAYNGADGAELAEQSWQRKKPQLKKMGAPSAAFLNDAIAKSEAPVKASKAPPPPVEAEDLSDAPDDADEEDEEPVAEKPKEKPRRTFEPLTEESAAREDEAATDDTEEARPSGDKSAQHPALVLWFGPRLMWRNLSYDSDGTLASYENSAGSAAFNLALGGQWYPAAHSRGDWLSNLGLEADLDYTLGLKSRYAGKEYKTSAYELGVGAIARIPFAAAEPRIRVGYVRQVFDSDVPTATAALPGVAYGAVRLGIGAALFLGDVVTLDANFAYLIGLGSGELEDKTFASGASVNAFEVGAGLLVAIKEVYGVRLGVDYRRWDQDFSEATSTTYTLPKGGSDSYLRATLAFVYRMPGMTKAKK